MQKRYLLTKELGDFCEADLRVLIIGAGLAPEREQGLRSYAEAQRDFGFSPLSFEEGIGLETE